MPQRLVLSSVTSESSRGLGTLKLSDQGTLPTPTTDAESSMNFKDSPAFQRRLTTVDKAQPSDSCPSACTTPSARTEHAYAIFDDDANLLCSLPGEVWSIILSHLPSPDIPFLRLTCHAARFMVNLTHITQLTITPTTMAEAISTTHLPPTFFSVSHIHLDLSGKWLMRPGAMSCLQSLTHLQHPVLAGLRSLELVLDLALANLISLELLQLLSCCERLDSLAVTVVDSKRRIRFALASCDEPQCDLQLWRQQQQQQQLELLFERMALHVCLDLFSTAMKVPHYLQGLQWEGGFSQGLQPLDGALLGVLPDLLSLQDLSISPCPTALPLQQLNMLTKLNIQLHEDVLYFAAAGEAEVLEGLCNMRSLVHLELWAPPCSEYDPKRRSPPKVPASWAELESLRHLWLAGFAIPPSSGLYHLGGLEDLKLVGCVTCQEGTAGTSSASVGGEQMVGQQFLAEGLGAFAVGASARNRAQDIPGLDALRSVTCLRMTGCWPTSLPPTVELLEFNHGYQDRGALQHHQGYFGATSALPANFLAARNLRHLSISARIISQQCVEEVAQISTLQHLDLQCTFDPEFTSLASLTSLTHLTHLNANAVSLKSANHWPCFQHFHNSLLSLHLNIGQGAPSFPDLPPSLTSLAITTHNLPEFLVPTTLRSCPCLQQLTVRCAPHMRGNIHLPSTLLPHLTSLRSLTLEHITSGTWVDALDCLSLLTSLKLSAALGHWLQPNWPTMAAASRLHDLDLAGLGALPTTLPMSLTRLAASRLRNPSALPESLSRCTQMDTLAVLAPAGLSGVNVLAGLTTLRSLDLGRLTDAAVSCLDGLVALTHLRLLPKGGQRVEACLPNLLAADMKVLKLDGIHLLV